MSRANKRMILHSKMGLLTLLKANILWLLQRSLHSNMGLLKRRSRISLLYYPNFYIPNMFLLKQAGLILDCVVCSAFTFHNVSIKTQGSSENLSSDPHLHSTMFLLKPMYNNNPRYNQQNLHSTMFLLKRNNAFG